MQCFALMPHHTLTTIHILQQWHPSKALLDSNSPHWVMQPCVSVMWTNSCSQSMPYNFYYCVIHPSVNPTAQHATAAHVGHQI